MLATQHRLRRPADFSLVVRRGARAGRSALVLHLLVADGEAGAEPPTTHVPAPSPARVGFVVPKSVGGSVVRHRVTRRLRALAAARLDGIPSGSMVVVRALPVAADRSFAELGRDLDGALSKVLARIGRPSSKPSIPSVSSVPSMSSMPAVPATPSLPAVTR